MYSINILVATLSILLATLKYFLDFCSNQGIKFPKVLRGEGLSTGSASGGIPQYDAISGLMVSDF